jgi:hypothetical protein
MAARSEAEVVGMSVALAVPLGIGIRFGAPVIARMGVGYFALQAGISAVETTVEGLGAYVTGSQFNALASFSKNFLVNSATGGIGTKLKWGGRAGAYLLRQGIEIAGDTAIDVGVYDNGLSQSLAWNSIGSIGGEVLASGIGRGLRSLHNNFEVRLNPGALTTFNSGLPINIISFSRRAPNRGTFRGGPHGETKLPWRDGLESHHMPAKSVTRLDPDAGPAIQMHKRDHLLTSSHGSRPGAAEYRAEIEDLLGQGRIREAMARAIRDVRRAALQGSGDMRKYNQAVREMLQYARRFGFLD